MLKRNALYIALTLTLPSTLAFAAGSYSQYEEMKRRAEQEQRMRTQEAQRRAAELQRQMQEQEQRRQALLQQAQRDAARGRR